MSKKLNHSLFVLMPTRQAGSFTKTVHWTVSKRTALYAHQSASRALILPKQNDVQIAEDFNHCLHFYYDVAL
jgi:hypothetical protein